MKVKPLSVAQVATFLFWTPDYKALGKKGRAEVMSLFDSYFQKVEDGYDDAIDLYYNIMNVAFCNEKEMDDFYILDMEFYTKDELRNLVQIQPVGLGEQLIQDLRLLYLNNDIPLMTKDYIRNGLFEIFGLPNTTTDSELSDIMEKVGDLDVEPFDVVFKRETLVQILKNIKPISIIAYSLIDVSRSERKERLGDKSKVDEETVTDILQAAFTKTIMRYPIDSLTIITSLVNILLREVNIVLETQQPQAINP